MTSSYPPSTNTLKNNESGTGKNKSVSYFSWKHFLVKSMRVNYKTTSSVGLFPCNRGERVLTFWVNPLAVRPSRCCLNWWHEMVIKIPNTIPPILCVSMKFKTYFIKVTRSVTFGDRFLGRDRDCENAVTEYFTSGFHIPIEWQINETVATTTSAVVVASQPRWMSFDQ